MKKFLVLIALCFGAVGQLMAANILVVGVTRVNTTDMTTGVNHIGDSLTAGGHSVTRLTLTGTTTGQIATALAGSSFDQVFFLDVGDYSVLGAADTTAIANFWATHKGLVVDGRSYGTLFQGAEPSEQALIRNVATAFTRTGGGLWIGTDDAPTWAHNGNAILSAIGVNPVTGNYSLPVNSADPSSVLLQGVTPANLWAAAGTVGAAPLGAQPNGIQMFLHFGNDSAGSLTPYISASFPLAGPPDPVGVPVNQPWALVLLALALAVATGWAQRRGG